MSSALIMCCYTRNHYNQLFSWNQSKTFNFHHNNFFEGFAEGLSLEANLNLDVSLETCFQNGGDVSSQVPEMGGLQLPINRLARQLLQPRAPRTNQLGGVVLQAPGASGAPVAPLQSHALRTNQLGGVVLQTPMASGASGAPGAPGASLQVLTPSQQALHSSLTAIHNVRKSKTL